MELESKFIEGTDNQYSIRNDGVVISHKTNRLLSVSNNRCTVKSVSKGKYITISINSALKEYFNNVECITKGCSTLVSKNRSIYCEKCAKESVLKYRKKYEGLNIDKYKEYQSNKLKRNKEEISKLYVSQILKIPINSLSNEVYQEYKIILQIKRLLAKKLNCSIKIFN